MNFEEKIKVEIKSFSGDRKAKLIYKLVSDALLDFCRQDAEFAQAVEQGGTLSDCCKVVCNGTGDFISDIEAYRKAVQYYFPGADVSFTMRINLCASVDMEEALPEAKPKSILDISLDDLLDF